MSDKTKKIKIVYAFSTVFLIFLLTLSACSKQDTIKSSENNQNSQNQVVPISIPDDIPVYPGAKQISNEQGNDFVRVVFSADSSVEEIKNFYNKEMPGKWAVTKDWFKLGNTEQRYHATDDFNEDKKTGRSVIIIAAPDNKDTEKSVVSLVITDFNK